MKKNIIYLLTLLLLCCFRQNIHAEYFRNLNLGNGLSQFSVMSICQDSLGRMWFGTHEGINIYDGHHIRYYKGWVESGPGEKLWLGNSIDYIHCGNDGNIYFIADRNLFTYDIRCERFSQLTTGNQTSALTTTDTAIWYTRHDTLFVWDTQKKQSLYVRNLPASDITALTITRNGNIYIGTDNGIYIAQNATDPNMKHQLQNKGVHTIFESSSREIWIGTYMDGLYRIINGKLINVPYSPHDGKGTSDRQIRQFTEDSQHNIWFGTFSGLEKYNPQTGLYTKIQIPQHVGGLSHPSLFALYTDRQGIIWLGSYYGGVSYFNPGKEEYLHYNYQSHAQPGIYYSYIGEMVQDNERNLWISTDGGGISQIGPGWNLLKQFTAGKADGLPHNNIKSIVYDPRRNNLYIGTYLGGLSRYDIRQHTFHNYRNRADNPGDIIYHLEIWNDKLYLTTRKGLFCLDPDTDTFQFLSNTSSFCEYFDISPQGTLYIMGWNYVDIFSLTDNTLTRRISMTPYDCYGNLSHILATDQGAYISTLGSGIYFYNAKSHEVTHYTHANSQLPSDYCYNIARVDEHSIAISTDKGITLFTPEKRQASTIVLPAEIPLIYGGGLYVSPQHEIYIGGPKGITMVPAESFRSNAAHNSPLYFSRLWINNRLVTPLSADNILDQILPFTHKLKLKHNQNNCIIEFTYSDHKEQSRRQTFEYKLEGFDDKWISTSANEIHYTNLDPGNYTLKVRPQQGSEEQTISLQIHISTPWYSTIWAWMLYLITIGAGSFWFVRNKLAKRALALSLEKERFEKQHIEEVNRAKLVFFTNVSHEFRTPLTLIISHLDALLQEQLPVQLYNKLLKIKQNTQYMTNLITELLDFRKFTQNHVILHLASQDICLMLEEIYLTFTDYAQQRKIDYTFESEPKNILCWIDRTQMEKVFFNLLSNAFKYTPDGGSIRLKACIQGNQLIIQTTDSGTGIPENEKQRIFERFFQGEDQKGQEKYPGTGIGLALTKNIVEAHHGTITVSSILHQGSTFTVTLPLEKEVFNEDTRVQFCENTPPKEEKAYFPPCQEPALPPIPQPQENPLLQNEPENETADSGEKKKYTLLLVEDNPDLLQTLKNIFDPFYRVITATNGKEGLSATFEHKPDIIISDIMMPEMNGTEMCLKIKSNIDLCHIPVILLTALNSTEQNIEGLNRGADDYITKPFDTQILLARTNNLVRNRLLIQHQLKKQPISEVDLASINPLDQQFLQKVDEVIEQHIDDVEFDIPKLCQEVGMGRSLLYSKFKALTGMTPNNFLLNYRLKYAATLLQKYPTLPIAEVSDRSGFSSPLYFSRCFKNQYGETPQNYRRKQSEDS